MTVAFGLPQKGGNLPVGIDPIPAVVASDGAKPSLGRRIFKILFIVLLLWLSIEIIGRMILVAYVIYGPLSNMDFIYGQDLASSWEEQSAFDGRLSDAMMYSPEQLHLSLGVNTSEAYVTWSTMKQVDDSRLIYREAKPCGYYGASRSAESDVTMWKTVISDPNWIKSIGGHRHRVLYTYRAKMTDLKPGKLYIYRAVSFVGTSSYTSKTYQYFARNFTDTTAQVSLALFGDLGLINGQSVPRLIQDVDGHKYDAIIHNGDFAYDLDTHGGKYGDEFMRLIEPIAARVPYQTSVGNHEAGENFTHYDKRFTMINSGSEHPGEFNNFYYSFNIGPIHFVAFSTEHYYFFDNFGMEALGRQYEWLKRDLEHANSPAERAKRPWIIVFGHRPMYCSGRDGDDCAKDTNILRKGLPFSGLFALEKLFYDHGVDVELYSHEHSYERFLPIYDGKVMSGTSDPKDPYKDPLGPVHFISGSAGCQERLDPVGGVKAPGSVLQIADYGYTRLLASRCELKFEQISDDRSGTVVDKFTITKSRQNFPVESQDQIDCQTSTRKQYGCIEEFGSWFCNNY